MGKASNPQKTLPSTSKLGTPNTPCAIASSLWALSCAFTPSSTRFAPGSQLRGHGLKPRGIRRIGTTCPHMFEQGLAHIAIGQARGLAVATASRSKPSGLKGCMAGKASSTPCRCANHCTCAVNPVPLGRHLSRAQHRVVLEQAAQKQRACSGHAVAQPHKRYWQLLKREVSVGRNEIQINVICFMRAPGVVVCRGLWVWVGLNKGFRVRLAQTLGDLARHITFLAASSLRPHSRMSSMVRKHPSHKPLPVSMRHTFTQGLRQRFRPWRPPILREQLAF